MRVVGQTELETLTVGLSEVLAAATGRDDSCLENPTESAATAVPIRGSGTELSDLFADLAADLIAQLELHGTGLDQIRLDGLLRTDDGLTAWGYAFGALGGGAPNPITVESPARKNVDGKIALSFTLQRGIELT